LRYCHFCPKLVKNCSKTARMYMASLLAIYGDSKSCKKMTKVVFTIFVDVTKHSEPHLTLKNGS
ncbi:MAG: hypothetical protein MJA29_08105, partial [Candidatus Omnitrophica bacterium]|nr:hypothetical protein [Candidatus Omnitrophota bacterium]